MAKPLRYDLAAEAIISLQRYLDTCADDSNTMALLQGVEAAVGKLVKIERTVVQTHERGKGYACKTRSALKEIENRVAEVQAVVKPLKEFVDQYQEEILAIRDMFGRVQEAVGVIAAMRSVERQLEYVKRRVTIV